MSDPQVTCDKCGPVIHLSGETCPLETAAAIDHAVIEIIMDLSAASSVAKAALHKKQAMALLHANG